MAGVLPPSPTTSSTTPGTPQTQGEIIQQAAATAGIPANILLGVYGSESTYGTAYASGGTTYGYFGLTSPGLWDPGMTFEQDANTAANLLASLYRQHGNNWNAALNAYSGGSYGLTHVEQLANNAPSALKNAITSFTGLNQLPLGSQVIQPAANAVSSVLSTADSIGNIFSWITTPAHWWTVLKFVGGAVLIFLALKALTGINVPSGGAGRVLKMADV